MARAFETNPDSGSGVTYYSEVEAEECAILIHAIDELIALLAPPDATVESLSEDPESKSSDPAADSLFEELGLSELFTAAGDVPVTEPEDPVTARLFPPGYVGDRSASRDFRRFTESELRRQKIQTALQLRQELHRATQVFPPRVEFGSEEAATWLRGLNDLRLTIAVQIGVGEPDELDRLARPEVRNLRGLYDFLTWWQDSLLEALM